MCVCCSMSLPLCLVVPGRHDMVNQIYTLTASQTVDNRWLFYISVFTMDPVHCVVGTFILLLSLLIRTAGFLSESVWLARAVINNGENRRKIKQSTFHRELFYSRGGKKSLFNTTQNGGWRGYFEFCSPQAENLKIWLLLCFIWLNSWREADNKVAATLQ